MQWQPVNIATKLYENVDETALSQSQAALENAYVTEAKSIHRFPGLVDFKDMVGDGPVYLAEWKEDMIAVTGDGQAFKVDKNGEVKNVTGVPISGGSRVVFAQTANELTMAAGGPIISFNGHKTDVLSKDAPNSKFVGHVDNYVLAVEAFSERFAHAEAGNGSKWNPLDIFSADSQPDDLVGLFVTPYRELILAGKRSIEQFERLTSGEVPFFRRWAVGEGTKTPYTMTMADNALWLLNSDREFVRLSGQIAQPTSSDIASVLQQMDDSEFKGAWAKKIKIEGQKFIILQMPNAVSPYGVKGVTYLLDYRQKKWTTLYGWDESTGQPSAWPGVSYLSIWGRHFVGGHGKIMELKTSTHNNAGKTQRLMGRTAHMGDYPTRMDNVRLRVKRGVGGPDTASEVMLRCRRDGGRWSRWVMRSLGKAGQTKMDVEFGGFGWADNFQFEYAVTDDCPVEILGMDVKVTRGR